jgi:transcriptional regulator with XRE-family HTH domain
MADRKEYYKEYYKKNKERKKKYFMQYYQDNKNQTLVNRSSRIHKSDFKIRAKSILLLNRIKLGYSVREFADILGLKSSTYQRIENGGNTTPKNAQILYQYFEMKFDDLFEILENPETIDYRAIYEGTTGLQIPENYVIHHLDGDHFNSEINNLICINGFVHSNYHKILRYMWDLVSNKNDYTLSNVFSRFRRDEVIFAFGVLFESITRRNTALSIPVPENFEKLNTFLNNTESATVEG